MNISHRIRKAVNQATAPLRVRFFVITYISIAILMLILSFATTTNRKTIFGPQLGADFASYYIAGQILNSPQAENLYDIPLQDRLYHTLFPDASTNETLLFPYAPFLAVLVKPLALVSYEVAFAAWLVINLICYLIGFLLLWFSNPDISDHSICIPILIAISFEPFLIEGWIGGQVVGLTMLILGLSIFLQLKERWWEGGVILSLCLFKPTLLVLAVPMVLISRKFKTFAGFLLGMFILLGVSRFAVGMEGLRGYLNHLQTYASAKVFVPEAFRLEKYIDLSSFAKLLSLPEVVVTIGVIITSLVVFFLLCRTWRESQKQDLRSVRITWACILIWTPILAPQCAIYDSILAVAAFVLIAGVHPLANPTRDADSESGFMIWAMCTYCTAFITTITAVFLGVQMLTIVLFGVGLWMLRISYENKNLEMG